MKGRKILAIVVALVMVFGTFSMAFAATESDTTAATVVSFTDVTDHWGAAAISKWAGYGIINGYEGLFRPNDSITRGEMAVILDNMMDYQETAKNTFTDLKTGQFYTEAVLKANAAGIIKGDGSAVRPTDKITKEEAAVMMSRAFAVADGSSTALLDASAISSWAKDAVSGMEAKSYVSGYQGNFNPKSNITRAEVVTMINNIVKAYYTAKGTYTDNVDGTAVIKVSDVTLKGVTVTGNLIVAEGVGKGNAYLDSVTVKGDTVVRGGGENSVHITGKSNIAKVVIEKVGDKLRVVIDDGISVSDVEVAAGEEIVITGTVGTVDVQASNATVYATAAEIKTASITGDNSKIIIGAKSAVDSVTVASAANNTKIETEKGAVVKAITASAEVSVSGTGTVTKVTLKKGADGSKVTTPNTTTSVAKDVTGVTGAGDKPISAGNTAINNTAGTDLTSTPTTSGGSNGGSSGGHSTPAPTLTLNEIKIDGGSVGTSGGAYMLKQNWTKDTTMTANVTGKNFVSTTDYDMIVTAASGGMNFAFEQTVKGSDMNVTDKDISQTNVLPKLSSASNTVLTQLLNAWTAKADVGDTITVSIKIKNGATLCSWNYVVISPDKPR